MRKSLIITVLLLVIGTSVFSQVKLRPGIRLGANISNISGLDDTSSKAGFNIGVFGNVHFSDFYELQLELSYSSQGANLKNSIIEGYYDYDDNIYIDEVINEEKVVRNINYVSVGLINKFFIANTGLHFIAGPSIDVTHDDDTVLGGLFPSVDFALTGGVGYEFPFGLAIEARYKQGLLEVDENLFTPYDSDYSYTYNGDGSYFNTVFQFSLSYKFDFNKK